MDSKLAQKLLPALMKSRGQAEITVAGDSMHPTLHEGNRITLLQCTGYEIGDILVFTYKTGELLVHRLLRKDGRFFCKGDNSFRLEDIGQDRILGKVILVNGKPVAPWPEWKTDLSYRVGRAFAKCRYSIEETKRTDVYRDYEKIILGKEELNMLYKKNGNMDYIQTDETSLAVFDPESGDTHFFDETGSDILNALSEPCGLDALLIRLCELYDASPEEIRPDVEEFLAGAAAKKVVEIL